MCGTRMAPSKTPLPCTCRLGLCAGVSVPVVASAGVGNGGPVHAPLSCLRRAHTTPLAVRGCHKRGGGHGEAPSVPTRRGREEGEWGRMRSGEVPLA